MSWIKIPMKFPGTCIVCNDKIEINEIGLWSKGSGVKHEKCAQTNELTMYCMWFLCWMSQCEFQDICDIPNVSQLCICKKCGDEKNAFRFIPKII